MVDELTTPVSGADAIPGTNCHFDAIAVRRNNRRGRKELAIRTRPTRWREIRRTHGPAQAAKMLDRAAPSGDTLPLPTHTANEP